LLRKKKKSFELRSERGERAGRTKLTKKRIPDGWSRKGESSAANFKLDKRKIE